MNKTVKMSKSGIMNQDELRKLLNEPTKPSEPPLKSEPTETSEEVDEMLDDEEASAVPERMVARRKDVPKDIPSLNKKVEEVAEAVDEESRILKLAREIESMARDVRSCMVEVGRVRMDNKALQDYYHSIEAQLKRVWQVSKSTAVENRDLVLEDINAFSKNLGKVEECIVDVVEPYAAFMKWKSEVMPDIYEENQRLLELVQGALLNVKEIALIKKELGINLDQFNEKFIKSKYKDFVG